MFFLPIVVTTHWTENKYYSCYKLWRLRVKIFEGLLFLYLKGWILKFGNKSINARSWIFKPVQCVVGFQQLPKLCKSLPPRKFAHSGCPQFAAPFEFQAVWNIIPSGDSWAKFGEWRHTIYRTKVATSKHLTALQIMTLSPHFFVSIFCLSAFPGVCRLSLRWRSRSWIDANEAEWTLKKLKS